MIFVSKRDNVNITLMTHQNVNLMCDNEVLKLRYRPNPDDPKYGVWFCNNKNTGLQVLKLIKLLREKYKRIFVTWKRQF